MVSSEALHNETLICVNDNTIRSPFRIRAATPREEATLSSFDWATGTPKGGMLSQHNLPPPRGVAIPYSLRHSLFENHLCHLCSQLDLHSQQCKPFPGYLKVSHTLTHNYACQVQLIGGKLFHLYCLVFTPSELTMTQATNYVEWTLAST